MNCNEKLETAKISLYNAEQIADIKENPVVKATILSVVKSIPVLGELIDSAIDIALNDFQQRKREELLEIILSDSEKITHDMVNDIEFIMNFAKILEAVNRLATNDKVVYFANLLQNSYFTEDKIKNDEFEEYLNLLNELSYREIYILFNFSGKYGYVHKSEFENGYMGKPLFKRFKTEMIKAFNITESELGDIMLKLQNKGLCIFESEHSLSNQNGEYRSMTSEYYKKFVKRIVGEIN